MKKMLTIKIKMDTVWDLLYVIYNSYNSYNDYRSYLHYLQGTWLDLSIYIINNYVQFIPIYIYINIGF